MKILLIHNYYQNIGGEDFYFDSLCQLLKSKGHKIFKYIKDNRLIKQDTINNIRILNGLFWNSQTVYELSKIIKKFNPQIVHFNNINPLITPTAYQICKKFGLKIIQTIHNYRMTTCLKGSLFRDGEVCEECVSKIYAYPAVFHRCYHNSYFASLFYSTSLLFHRLINSYNNIDTYIFPNNFTKNYFIERLNFQHLKTTTIPYFIIYKKENRILTQLPSQYFIFVGRLSEEKGILQLLNIFESLPNMKLMVIGDGPLRNDVNKFKKYKNIIIKNFLPRPKIFSYMKNAIATIIPSLFYETGPIVMIESFANGTSVIVPKFGSFRETVKEGRTGLFFEYRNFEDLREKLLYFPQNKKLVEKMRYYAKKEYERKYTPEKHYQALLKVYKSLVK